ncbi:MULTISPECIES: ribosomal protein S18-alanine N-acetyltransferase [unclassified Clostridioides]|uniref:ribosomal protein S18-alanine N-acetyltransferase n=1 Tax=unclassified Clostridioides TaxID=2635829 RepID=UPI001D121CD5|nr:ribosomal protein S18-alanine N-acetyltransferase [Clostridioides sp. ES-S-0001-02]MCC0641193.1 ribosomal protein S18-alanine N-acetyltransferase [Clostridioides sp. ES-S-0049-03]MCC0657872.1 ribosomal protein S18-alanine N-acetyltransferase [Clostridioides sp. ES-S-0123-01]MCC0674128.1 ribosomal protein S18-alanine N-acetyltransferase [Clostridioides sp. ES-S-0145-01]MCC0677128.1 ribosomal protein S18-alanine N-acetyltransferase [Clostridioides sp. ES-W-0018-02]MCC0681765.1 ribosomal prote
MKDNTKQIIDDVKIEEMTIKDIDEVFEVEKNCFEDYWSKESFRKELSNEVAKYIVAKLDGKVVGYVGIWLILDEGHINNVAVHSDYRGKKIGDKLIKRLVDLCKDNNIASMTLEVRASNKIAQNLYRKYGFKMGGIRKEYYNDNKEDAIIMWNQLKEV